MNENALARQQRGRGHCHRKSSCLAPKWKSATVKRVRSMPEILLTTLNAKYIHSAFGLRYLAANLGELRPRSAIAEFDINQRANDVVESILRQDPKIVGLGVYIWNATISFEVVSQLKKVSPRTI